MIKYAQQILDLVLCSTEHPTAEQIFLQMKQENSKIAQATVYNNLNALVADGKLIRLPQPGAPDRYDNTTRHDHLICTRCGASTAFSRAMWETTRQRSRSRWGLRSRTTLPRKN